ncbi:MAG: histidinol-phosphate transaminase [Bacteroidaceae bacterium]|nr:histidinol-phosphate transaminase [Bacteroidaceae bacterium]
MPVEFNLEALTRNNIRQLSPYSCARDEFKGRAAEVFLDANENPYNSSFNRYPDPLQEQLKAQLAPLKGVGEKQIFLGNGSDEAIDLVYRVFCEPRIDNVVAIAPTYGMYKVCADINDVEYRAIPLTEDFQLDADALLAATDNNTKVIWICSPNNPTGNSLDANAIKRVLTEFGGIVVVDEAYSDFSNKQPFRTQLATYPNLIVLNTFSKLWASAAIRLGMAFASEDIIALFNKVKYPYNVNLLTQQKAMDLLTDIPRINNWRAIILRERAQMLPSFAELPTCLKVFPTDANFFLARMTDANRIYQYLVGKGIIVRNRSRVKLCEDCLRITIGTPQENNALLAAMRQYK